MKKTVLITGSTDGIGLETAKQLATMGHRVWLHGRNPNKLELARQTLAELMDDPTSIKTFVADLSSLAQVDELAKEILALPESPDVLINNAGIFRTSSPLTGDGLDVRFVVNTIAPYRLCQRLWSRFNHASRIINLSSAAQAPVELDVLTGQRHLSDEFQVYAQSKLALTMWTRQLGLNQGSQDPVLIAVNPGSMLGSKMVTEGFGVAGGDLSVGASILARAALDDEFAQHSGEYFDNDSGNFSDPHAAGLSPDASKALIDAMDNLVASLTQ